MLSRLHIRGLAVIDEVSLDLGAGFSALTGETGAGKSMLVDALALALGARADSSAVRSGAQRAEVSAVFDLAAESAASRWLGARDLDASGECQLRRIVTPEGRSRAYINGEPMPLESLRELGALLVEICGQHAHQSLLQPATQRMLLDAHGGHQALLDAVAEAHAAASALDRELAALRAVADERRAREELLGYQVRELEALNLQAGEVEALEQERLLLANAGRITAGLGQVLDQIYDAEGSSAHDMLGGARRQIDALLSLDPQLRALAEALDAATIHVADAAEQLRRRLGSLDHDPTRLDEIETRLGSIFDLARKYHCDPGGLLAHFADRQQELQTLGATAERIETLEAQTAAALQHLQSAARALTTARSATAERLAARATTNLRGLGMPEATLTVRIAPLPDAQISAHGADQVELLVATNAGQHPGPIARVASGGELSRLSLAVAVITMTESAAPTLIFDEVDAGIGGAVAEMVGQCLHQLSGSRQVLCVTHLPQVASQADHHYTVVKKSEAGATRALVQQLAADERVEEIARMLGGLTITTRTRAHAREMLQLRRGSRS